jgi:hypothetical protein
VPALRLGAIAEIGLGLVVLGRVSILGMLAPTR